MNRYYHKPRTNDLPKEQPYSLNMALHHYPQISGTLGANPANIVLAHQIFFPRSSPIGMDTLTRTVRALHGPVAFERVLYHHEATCKRVAQQLIEEGQGFALLLAGTLEHDAQESFPTHDPQARLRQEFLDSDFFQQEFHVKSTCQRDP